MKSLLPPFRPAIALALTFVLTVIASMLWLKADHVPSAAMRVAQAFVDRLQAGKFAQAHELTVKNNDYVGTTPAEFERIARRQFCGAIHLVSTFPFQSNGNRLRRWLAGAEVEMPEVRVEFAEGACLFGVSVRHQGAGQWQVYSFASHAG